MKNVGIIGGSKFIGNYITLKFLAEGYRVKVQVPEKEKVKSDSVFKRISINRNLDICRTELTNTQQINDFTENCEVLIHCGQPFQLDIKSSEVPIYVPLIKNTNVFIKAIQSNKSIKKVIFITSAMAFNPGYISPEDQGSTPGNKNQESLNIEMAKFHAERAVSRILDSFPKNFFEVVYISPVEVENEMLSNSSYSTSSGLQFLFRKKITPDVCFEKLLKRQVIDQLTNINELPEKVFLLAAPINPETEEATIKKGQLPAL